MKDTQIGALAGLVTMTFAGAAFAANLPFWPRAIPIIGIGTLLIVLVANQAAASKGQEL